MPLQNRALWQTERIEQAHLLLCSALRQQAIGPYQLQAAISGLHSQAPSWQLTDWQQIYALYQLLETIQPSPVISLNLCVALAYRGKAKEAYARIQPLYDSLHKYQPFYAAKAEIATLLDRERDAIEAYQHAISLTHNQVEKAYLGDKLRALKSRR